MRHLIFAIAVLAWAECAVGAPFPGVPGDADFDPGVQIVKQKLDVDFDPAGFGANVPTPKTPAEATALKGQLDQGIAKLDALKAKLDAAKAMVDADVPTQAAYVAKKQKAFDEMPKHADSFNPIFFENTIDTPWHQTDQEKLDDTNKRLQEELDKSKRGLDWLTGLAGLIGLAQAKVQGEQERLRTARAAVMQSEAFQVTDFQQNLNDPRYGNINPDQVVDGNADPNLADGNQFFVVNEGDSLSELAAKAFPDYPIYGPGGSLEAIMASTPSADGTLSPGATVDLTKAAVILGQAAPPAGN